MPASRTRTAILLSLAFSAYATVLAAGKEACRDRYGDPLPHGAVQRFGTTRLRHLGRVLALAWSPNGKLLASSSQDRTIHLWDAASGRLVRSFPKGCAFSLAFSPDGKHLATGLDGQACVWEVSTAREVLRLDALSPKLRRLVEQRKTSRLPGGDVVDGRIYDERWSPDTKAVAFSPDGKLLVMGGKHPLTVWEVPAGRKRLSLDLEHPFAAFSADGKQIVTTDVARSVRLWDAQTGKRIGGFETEGPKGWANIFSLAVSPDGKHAALKLLNHLVLVELPSGKVVWREKSYGQQPEPVAFSPDGRLLAFVGVKGVRIWEWARDKQVEALPEGGGQACAFSPDGKRLAWAWGNDTIGIWDLAGRKVTPSLQRCPCGWFTLRPDGKAFVTLAGGVPLWDTSSGQVCRTIPLPRIGYPGCLTFSPDGRTLFIGDYEATIAEVDLGGEGKRCLHRGPVKDCYVIALAPGGERALAVSPNSRVTHLVADGGRDWRDYTGPDLKVHYAAYTPNGKHLIVTDGDSLLYLDAASAKRKWQSEKSPGRFNSNFFKGSLAGSPDGRLVAAGSEWQWGMQPQKGCVRLFDAVTGRERARLATPYFCIHALAFSADSRFLIASSTPYPFASHLTADEAHKVVISLWEVVGGAEIRRFEGHENLVEALAFAPDGRTFYSASADETVLQWDAFGLSDPAVVMPGQVEASWADLADPDAAKAYRAVGRLVASPGQACALIDRHLQPAQAIAPEHLAALVRDLDSDQFATREAALRELRSLGEQADAELEKALDGSPSLEARRRIEGLLKERRARPYSAEELRRLRAILVLEWIGSAQARRSLQRLAGGTAAVSHVRSAREALKRLQHRPEAAR